MPEHTVEAAQKRARKGYHSADEEQRTKVRAHPSLAFRLARQSECAISRCLSVLPTVSEYSVVLV